MQWVQFLPQTGLPFSRRMLFSRDTVSDCEDRYDEIERRIRFPQKASLAEEKQSMEFINLMERYLVELEDRLMNFRDVEYNGFVKTESEIIELFYFKFQDFPLLSRMDAVADYFIDEVETLRDRDLADDEKDLIREKFMKLYVTGDLYVIYKATTRCCSAPPERRLFCPLPCRKHWWRRSSWRGPR